MQQLTYQVSFTTPAFLGNAEQQAQWRTPPFKALIRQWWRVVKAREVGYNVKELHAAESELFGAASDDGKIHSHRSRLRLTLKNWDKLVPSRLESLGRVNHPEVGEGTNGMMIEAGVYLGYGPVTTTANRSYIPEKIKNSLVLQAPDTDIPALQKALQLASWFGTIGSRSRNGWGALILELEGGSSTLLSKLEVQNFTLPLSDCLKRDWPHAVGTDHAPLIWKTAPNASWREIMKELARIKIAFRTQATPFPNDRPRGIQDRHLLAYPITHHSVPGWERLSNQIRFKVNPTLDGKFEGIIVHLPCTLPSHLLRGNESFIKKNELGVWQRVHSVLDRLKPQLTRLA